MKKFAPAAFYATACTVTLSVLLAVSPTVSAVVINTDESHSAQQHTQQDTQTQHPQGVLTNHQEAARAAAEARAFVSDARRRYPVGSASIDQELWGKAVQAIEAAIKIAPENPDYLRLRAQIYTEVGFWKQAELSWSAYFRVAPVAAGGSDVRAAALAQYNLGYAAYKRKQIQIASRFFQRCLDFTPKNTDCLNWTGRIALENGQYEKAQRAYGQAVQINPKERSFQYFRELSKTAAAYGAAATRSFTEAYTDLDAGKRKKAMQGFLQAGKLAPSFIEAWREAGRLALQTDDLPAALTAYRAATSLSTANDGDRFNLRFVEEAEKYGLQTVRTFRAAYNDYSKGDRKKAATGFQAAVIRNPQYAKAWSWLGRVHYEEQRFEQATSAYEKAVELDPADKASVHFLKMSRKASREESNK